MAEKTVCPICGSPTRVYMGNARKDGLCAKHADEFKAGKLLKCEKCGEWHYTNEPCKCTKKNTSAANTKNENTNVCVVCGSKVVGDYKQCKNCYNETLDYKSGLNKNSSISELRQYYYHLKDYIFRMEDIDKIKTNCNKLIAIAIVNANSNDDNALLARVYKDVSELIERKQKYNNDSAKESTAANADVGTKSSNDKPLHLNYSTDGHALDSDMEVRIDDILYTSEIFHCCHMPVTDITEKDIICDWFIPIDSINKGIYIEYNGMKTPEYIKKKSENIALYRKYNLPLIIIEKDEPNNDSQTFKANLIREIQQKANEYFGGMPKWRK